METGKRQCSHVSDSSCLEPKGRVLQHGSQIGGSCCCCGYEVGKVAVWGLFGSTTPYMLVLTRLDKHENSVRIKDDGRDDS